MSATEGRRIVECDWLDTMTGNRLHHAHLNDRQSIDLFRGRWFREALILTCGGLAAGGVGGLGPFTPEDTIRCAHCCDRLGYPRGKGSPKNDPALKAKLDERLKEIR